MYSYADAYGAFADASRDQQSPSVTGSINRKPIQQASSSSSPSSYAADDGPVPSESSTLVGGNSSRSSRSGGYAMNGLPRRTCAHALKYSLIYFIWNVLVLTLATAGVIWLIWIQGDPTIWRNPYFIALECVVVIAIVFDVLLEMCVQQCRKFWCICVPRNGDTPMFCCGRQGYVFVVSCYTAFMLSMLWRSLTLSLSLSLSLSLTHSPSSSLALFSSLPHAFILHPCRWLLRVVLNYAEVTLAAVCVALAIFYLKRAWIPNEEGEKHAKDTTVEDALALALLVVRYFVYVVIICRNWDSIIQRQGGCLLCLQNSFMCADGAPACCNCGGGGAAWDVAGPASGGGAGEQSYQHVDTGNGAAGGRAYHGA